MAALTVLLAEVRGPSPSVFLHVALVAQNREIAPILIALVAVSVMDVELLSRTAVLAPTNLVPQALRLCG